MDPLYRLPLSERLPVAAVAYLRYIGKLVWPTGLSPIYPLPAEPYPLWMASGAVAMLLAATAAAWALRRRAPYVLAGWLWFAGMLVPVCGIVQVGYAAMADRYMYLPMAGPSVAAVWAGAEWLRRRASERLDRVVTALVCIAIAALASASQRQTAVWRDSVSLFTHAIAVTNDNAEAYAHLGVAYLRQNKPADAIAPFEEAVRIRPRLRQAHTNLGVAYRLTGQPERAVIAHEAALRIDPNKAGVHANLAIALIDLGRYAEAEQHLRTALEIDPKLESARAALATLEDAKVQAAPK